jgi:hypothetical protein
MTSPPIFSRQRGVSDLTSVVSWDEITEVEILLYQGLYFVTQKLRYF